MKSFELPARSRTFPPENPERAQTLEKPEKLKDKESSDKGEKLFVYDIQRNEAKIVRRDAMSSKIYHVTAHMV